MKKIAIIIPSLNNGGAERTAANLAISLKEVFDIHIIVFDGKNIAYPYSGKIHDLHLAPRKSIIGKAINILLRFHKVSKIKKQEKFDISLSLMDGPNLINVLSKKNDIVFTSVRNQLSKQFPRNGLFALYLKLQLRFCCFFSERVITLSKGVEEDLINNYSIPHQKIKTIYNPCNINLLLEKSADALLNQFTVDSHTVTTMGRMSYQKGQWLLIRAFRIVVKRIPDAKLIILGTGYLEETLKKMVEHYHLEKNILFTGFIESPHKIIQASRIFAFPSLYEGLGNVLIEALSCGTPCIACDCLSGPREILAPGTKYIGNLDTPEYAQYGILVKVNNSQQIENDDKLNDTEEQLAKTIIEMINNEDIWQKYHKQSLKRADDFSYENIKREWKALLETYLR